MWSTKEQPLLRILRDAHPHGPTPKAKPIPPRPRHRPNAGVQAQWVRTQLQNLPYEPPVEDYRQCTNDVLKGMCRVRGLPVSGLKQHLAERLQEIDNRVWTAEIHYRQASQGAAEGPRRRTVHLTHAMPTPEPNHYQQHAYHDDPEEDEEVD